MQRTDPAYCQALRFLLDRINYEKTVDRPYHASEFKLARMTYLLELLGNPQLAAPVLHVAGTKGKELAGCWLKPSGAAAEKLAYLHPLTSSTSKNGS